MELLAMRTRAPSAAEQYPLPRSLDDLINFSVMPHDHRNYALTWYALSGATALLAISAARGR
jgi:surfeit locus 1 family protein